MNFFDFKDFNDMCQKMGFTTDEGLTFLNKELEKRGYSNEGNRTFTISK